MVLRISQNKFRDVLYWFVEYMTQLKLLKLHILLVMEKLI